MDRITNSVEIRKGVLGYIVKGQKGVWYGNKPPMRERGDISSFSRKSRQRLREFLATAKPVEPSNPFGFCFTIPGDVISPDLTRKIWHDFVKEYSRNFRHPFIWRIELQQRKQAHWHCVFFISLTEGTRGVTFNFADAFKIKMLWEKIVWKYVGHTLSEKTARAFFDGVGVDIKMLEGSSATGVVGYLCDHTSKHKQVQLGWNGRQWGIVNRRALTFSTELVGEVTLRVHTLAARQMRRLQECLRTRGGKYTGIRVTPAANVSTAVFGNDASRLLKCYDIAHNNS